MEASTETNGSRAEEGTEGGPPVETRSEGGGGSTGPGKGRPADVRLPVDRRLPLERVEAMFSAYCERQSAEYISERTGVSWRAVKKYIEEGDSSRGILPFRRRYRRVARLVTRQTEERVAYEKTAALAAAAEHLESLDEIIERAMGPILSKLRTEPEGAKVSLKELLEAIRTSVNLKVQLLGRVTRSVSEVASDSLDGGGPMLPPALFPALAPPTRPILHEPSPIQESQDNDTDEDEQDDAYLDPASGIPSDPRSPADRSASGHSRRSAPAPDSPPVVPSGTMTEEARKGRRARKEKPNEQPPVNEGSNDSGQDEVLEVKVLDGESRMVADWQIVSGNGQVIAASNLPPVPGQPETAGQGKVSGGRRALVEPPRGGAENLSDSTSLASGIGQQCQDPPGVEPGDEGDPEDWFPRPLGGGR